LIEVGALGRSDAVALFMILRGIAERGSIVRDIGDCVAHDERDRGDLYEHANAFVRGVRRTIAVGGVLESPVLYPVDELLDEISRLFAANSLSLNRSAADAHVAGFVNAVSSILDGVTIKVRTPHVACRLSGGQLPGLAIDFLRPMPSGVLKIPGLVTLMFPLLHSESESVDPAVVAQNQAAMDASSLSRSMFQRAERTSN
jgi:hypothetical protein